MVQMTNFVALRNGGGVDPRDKRVKDRVGFSDVGNRGSYTPGGDSFKNYSQQDQETMFKAAGGKDKFIEQAADIEQRSQRSADTQRFLDRVNLFNRFQNRGDEIVRNPETGRQILSMQDPRLTAQAPTFGQLMGDIGRGIGSIAQGFAEKGPPVVQFLNALRTGVMDFISPAQNEMIGMERQVGFGNQELNDFNSLNKSQQNTYLMLKKSGATHMEAFNQAKLQTMAMGGIATLQ
tara:strand:- start:12 stop:716 length:705 start_codon:yes stop_codon:yes gene_type:complete